MKSITQESLVQYLKQGQLRIHFVKTDGTTREMLCTLDSTQIPPPVIKEGEETKTKKIRKVNPDVCSVWDIQNAGWRSFRFDAVFQIDVNDDTYVLLTHDANLVKETNNES